MNHEDITLAVRMIARGMVNHETVQALVAELTRVIAQGQNQRWKQRPKRRNLIASRYRAQRSDSRLQSRRLPSPRGVPA